MATNLTISENQERVPLSVGTRTVLRSVTPDDGSPYYVGARAYVTQNDDGATVTVIDKEGTTTADIFNGQNGADGQDGADGADGFSPIATVSKVGDTATITITDINGTTTAEVYDGASGASAFVAEFGTTTYADVKDAYDNDAILICTVDDSGNTMVLQLVYFDATNEAFYFAEPNGDGWYWTVLSNADGWDDGTRYLASTDVATQLADGLMSALDKQKLDGIASGAEVNVQSDWSQSDNTKDDFIKNKPTNVSSFVNDAGYLTSFTETDPVFSASDAASITSSDITSWNGKSTVSVSQITSTGTNIADITVDGTTTHLYAPSGGGGAVTDVEVNGTSVVTGGVAEIDLTGKSDVGHTHTTSAITDFPSLATVATSGDYDDLIDKPTIPTVNDATLTIQKNGTDVQTFTANASSNVTANITVPTDTGDLTNGAGYITGVTSTDTPTADTIAEFDASAHMNSTDMTSQEVEDFVDGLTPSALEVETASYNGITAYRCGKVVTLFISSSVTGTSAGWKAIDTVGERFRPPSERCFVGYNNSDSSYSNSRPLMMDVMDDGRVRVYLFSDKLTVAPRSTVTYIVTT